MIKYLVANWKMNMTPEQAVLFVERITPKIGESKNTRIVICPPYIDLYPMSQVILGHHIKLGSQDLHNLDEGPHTGDISATLMKGLIDYAIIGHSERRAAYGERDSTIAKKVAAAIRNGITTILCVGDRLADRTDGHSQLMVGDQLRTDLSMITEEEVSKVIIAYEPVWAISKGDGRGLAATPDVVLPMISKIRNVVEDLFGSPAGKQARVLYGGSANSENTKAFLSIKGVDGLLIGGASLNYQEFASMIKIAQDL